MPNTIAVGHLPYFRLGDVLLFDKIFVHSLEANIEQLKNNAHPLGAGLEKLQAQGILQEIPSDKVSEEIQEKFPIQFEPDSTLDPAHLVAKITDNIFDQKIRFWEMMLRSQGQTSVLLVDEYALTNQKYKNSKSVKVTDIKVRGVPQPRGDASIEQIMELRSDPTAQGMLYLIYQWMRSVGEKGVPEKSVLDELMYHINDYGEYLSSTKLSIYYGEERMLCSTSSKMMRQNGLLSIEAPYDQLISLSAQSVNLMEPEFVAPGCELAYLRSVE